LQVNLSKNERIFCSIINPERLFRDSINEVREMPPLTPKSGGSMTAVPAPSPAQNIGTLYFTKELFTAVDRIVNGRVRAEPEMPERPLDLAERHRLMLGAIAIYSLADDATLKWLNGRDADTIDRLAKSIMERRDKNELFVPLIG
jgi:hypothetical protein